MHHYDLITSVKQYLSQPAHEQDPAENSRLLVAVQQHQVNSNRMGAVTGWLWQYSQQLKALERLLLNAQQQPRWPGGYTWIPQKCLALLPYLAGLETTTTQPHMSSAREVILPFGSLTHAHRAASTTG